MARAEPDMKTISQRRRRAHFLGHRLAKIGGAFLEFLEDALQHFNALLAAGLGPAGESLARGGDRTVHVGGRTKRDLAGDLLGRRIDGLDGLTLNRVHPGAIDVEFEILAHGLLFRLWRRGRARSALR